MLAIPARPTYPYPCPCPYRVDFTRGLCSVSCTHTSPKEDLPELSAEAAIQLPDTTLCPQQCCRGRSRPREPSSVPLHCLVASALSSRLGLSFTAFLHHRSVHYHSVHDRALLLFRPALLTVIRCKECNGAKLRCRDESMAAGPYRGMDRIRSGG